MNIPQPADVGEQLAAQTDKLAQSVSAIAEKIDTQDLRDRAGSGAADLLDAATTREGRPKKGLLIGVVLVVVALLVARRALR